MASPRSPPGSPPPSYVITLVTVVDRRLRLTPEGELALSSEAVWGMMLFATLPALLWAGALFAAWQSRSLPSEPPWRGVDVAALGGPPG
jgi:hypothetical protein